PLVEDDEASNAFPVFRIDDRGEAGASTDDTAKDVDKYRRVYLDAAERVGRESWEVVEEDAIREALEEIGFGELLDAGELFNVRGWRFTDFADDGEEADRRWYYPDKEEPRPDEFRRFHELLTAAAPDDYTPTISAFVVLERTQQHNTAVGRPKTPGCLLRKPSSG
ncbi:hypothetical protein, partial [Halovenus salina]